MADKALPDLPAACRERYPDLRILSGVELGEPHWFADQVRALEVNTRLPLDQQIVRWYEVGGEAVSFGSDAHNPTLVARTFPEAAAMVEAQGFRPGRAPDDFWVRGAILYGRSVVPIGQDTGRLGRSWASSIR